MGRSSGLLPILFTGTQYRPFAYTVVKRNRGGSRKCVDADAHAVDRTIIQAVWQVQHFSLHWGWYWGCAVPMVPYWFCFRCFSLAWCCITCLHLKFGRRCWCENYGIPQPKADFQFFAADIWNETGGFGEIASPADIPAGLFLCCSDNLSKSRI